MAMNHIVLVGTIDRAPERRTTPEGYSITTFRVKVVRPSRQEGTPPGVDFIPVIASRRMADVAAGLVAGQMAAVEGRMVTRTVEQNGKRLKLVEVDAASVQALDASVAGTAVDKAVPVAADLQSMGASVPPVPAPYGDEAPDFDTDVPF